MSNKLDFEKDRRNRMDKELDTDGLVSLNEIGRKNAKFLPKINVAKAKQKTQTNLNILSHKLIFMASKEFDAIFSNSRKESLIQEVEDLIHKLRASTIRSACLPDDHPLIFKARTLVARRRAQLPAIPAIPFGFSKKPIGKL